MPLERKWETYEEVARQLISDVRDYLKLGRIEEKQKVKGYITNTEWEVDVVAYNVDDGKLVLVECKHKSKSTLSQESLAGFAYRIKDTNADHGIIVTTIGLQEGAEKIAKAEKITLIRLDYNSTSENYIAQIANQIFIKMTDRVKMSDCVEMKLYDKDGNLKDTRKAGGLG
jgi:predicted helicase